MAQSYSPFHPNLNEKYPIDKMLRKDIQDRITSGKINRYGWRRVLEDQHLENPDELSILGLIINEAVKGGGWINIPEWENEKPQTGITREYLLYETKPTRVDWERLSDNLAQKGLVEKVIDDEGRKMLAPTEKLLEFLSQKFTEYKIKP